MYRSPVKSMPVTANGSACWSLDFGSRSGSGISYGNPEIFLQVTQWLISFLTCCRPAGIQYLWRRGVSVEFTPACNWRTCVSRMTSSVNGSFGGCRSENLADLVTGALWILLLQWMRPASSRKRRSWRTSAVRGEALDSMLLVSWW